MYTPTQISAIKIFGKKDLSFGCLLFSNRYITYIAPEYGDSGPTGSHRFIDDGDNSFIWKMKDVEILGHIPSLEDLFQVAMDKGYSPAFYYDEEYSKYIVSFERKIADRQFTQDDFPYNPILPLLDQPNLEEIISLFK